MVNLQPSMEFYTWKVSDIQQQSEEYFPRGGKLKSKYNKVLKEKNYFIN